MEFVKYHALGNDYLVIDPVVWPQALDADMVRRLCARHHGAGADGVLFGPLSTPQADFGLRIFNPDGSEAEKSGNGLRIFARALWDRGLLAVDPSRPQVSRPFSVQVPAGVVTAQVLDAGRQVQIDMGQAVFTHPQIDEILEIDSQRLRCVVLSLGNPHCVVLDETPSEALARRLGPQIECAARFPKRTNVQFVQVLNENHIRIFIWERGAGYTLASGSSSCAAAAAVHRLGLCQAHITVHNPGGDLDIAIAGTGSIMMTGPVARVYSGQWEAELAEQE